MLSSNLVYQGPVFGVEARPRPRARRYRSYARCRRTFGVRRRAARVSRRANSDDPPISPCGRGNSCGSWSRDEKSPRRKLHCRRAQRNAEKVAGAALQHARRRIEEPAKDDGEAHGAAWRGRRHGRAYSRNPRHRRLQSPPETAEEISADNPGPAPTATARRRKKVAMLLWKHLQSGHRRTTLAKALPQGEQLRAASRLRRDGVEAEYSH